MADKNELSESRANELVEKDSDQLYELLGLTVKAVKEDLPKQGSFEPGITYSDHLGPMEDLQKIGRRVFNKVHVQAYNLVCGSDPEDKTDRDRIVGALGLSASAAVVAITGVLISTFGLAAALAGVIAALIYNRFIKPAGMAGIDTVCEIWKENLPHNG